MSGAADPYRDARENLREYDRMRASIVRRQITDLLHVIDQRIERALECAQSLDAHAGSDGTGRGASTNGDPGKIPLENSELPTEHAAHGIDSDLEKIEAILDYRKAIRTGLFHDGSPVLDRDDDRPVANDAHRLSETAK